MGTTKLNIGKIPISKGEYQEGTAYQRLNQVTMLGSTYQSKIDDNTSAPAQMGADGAVENINTDKWLCVAVGNVSAARRIVYNNETSGLQAENVQTAIDELGSKVSDLAENAQDAIDALQSSKFDKTSIAQESGSAEDKVMSQKATTTAIADETTRAKSAEQAIIYDVSAHNSGVVFESLSALLSSSNLSTLIPTSVRHGGMSIRFIQGSDSDHKYMQYRLMATSFSTTVTNWQGVDDEPTARSNNLVTSGGVSDALNNVSIDVNDVNCVPENAYYTFSSTTVGQSTTVTKISGGGNVYSCSLNVKQGDVISLYTKDNNSRGYYALVDDSGILRVYVGIGRTYIANKLISDWNGTIYVQGVTINLKKFGLKSTELAPKEIVDVLYDQLIGINFYQRIEGDLNAAIVNNTALVTFLPDSPIKGVNKVTGNIINLYLYVKEGLQIKLSNCRDNATNRAYCFTDENLVPISDGYSSGNSSTVYNTTLTTPRGAKVLFLSLNQSTASVEVLREKSDDITAIESELANHEERIEDIEETLVRNIYSYNNTVSAQGSTNITCYLSAGVTYLLKVSTDVSNFTLGVHNVGENLGTMTAEEVHQITPQNDISNIYFEKYGNVLIQIYVIQTLDERFEEIEPYMVLKTKYPTFAILGDSYSTFAGYLDPESNVSYYPADNVTSVNDTWWGMLCKDEGMLLMQNNSYSGTYVCNAESAGALVANSFVNRMQNLPKASVIFVFGGTNDSWNNVDLGEYKYSEWTENDLKQFRPAYAYMLDYLIKHHLGARIICLKNPYADNGTGFTQDIEASVDAICEHYGIETCVNYVISKASNWHPNKTGMTQIKTAVVQLLNT